MDMALCYTDLMTKVCFSKAFYREVRRIYTSKSRFRANLEPVETGTQAS